MPIGALCGKAKYMDALDGGGWQYGDESFPEVGVTFFAGTFVRHPLAVRSALSVLTQIKREGPALAGARQRARRDVWSIRSTPISSRSSVPMRMTCFRSMMYFRFPGGIQIFEPALFPPAPERTAHLGRPARVSFHRSHRRGRRVHHPRLQGEHRGIARGRFPARGRKLRRRCRWRKPVAPAASAPIETPAVDQADAVQPLFLRQLRRGLSRGQVRAAAWRPRNSPTRTASPPSGCRSAIFTPWAVSRRTRRCWPARWRGRRSSCSCAAAAWSCRCIIRCAWRRSGRSSIIFRRGGSRISIAIGLASERFRLRAGSFRGPPQHLPAKSRDHPAALARRGGRDAHARRRRSCR